jgi:PAS domain S-box-containing protein
MRGLAVNKLLRITRKLLDISTTDPDDARRRKLLNILTLFVLVGTFVAVGATLIFPALGLAPPPPTVNILGLEIPLIVTGLLQALVGTGIIYTINRYWSGDVASSLFLLLITVSILTSPNALSSDVILSFAIPIVTASFLLRPYASFIMTGLISLGAALIGINTPGVGLQVGPMLTFLLIALVSWIAARSLENALASLRTLNRELDQRVVERTQELASALAREQTEANKNQAILKSIADGVIVFDKENQAIVANPAVANLLGQPFDEIIGRDIETLMSDEVQPDDQRIITDLLEESDTAHSGIKLKWGNKTLSVSIAPVRDPSHRVSGTVAVFRDFTREAEIDRLKSTFISIASHELRTPLNAILGYTEMLQQAVYGSLSNKQYDIVERVMANAGRLLSLANNLLDQAQMEAGKLTLTVAAFTPTDLIKSMHHVMDVMARTKGLTLTSHIADDVPTTLYGDQQRLHQILINLVNNAIKFTDYGTVSVRFYMPNADHWAMAVSDTGHGIPAEARAYIFEPFRQANDPITRNSKGAGLGLSIVKQLITLMKGKITLESQVGRGSTFTIVLPLAVEEMNSEYQPSA